MNMEKIKIGKIVNVVGLKGEVKLYNYADGSDIYETVPAVFMEDKLLKIEKVREQKNVVILKLEGIDSREMAEAARGKELYITEEDLPQLPSGQFYVRDLIGMTVKEEDGSILGELTDVIQNTAQDIFEVAREDGKTVLIPKVDEFVLDIDGDNRVITVRLMEGMLDL